MVHDEGRGRSVDVGVVTFRLGDLVAQRELAVSAQSVDELRLEAEIAALPDGAFAGLQPIPDETNVAPAWSVPSGASAALRLVAVDATVSPADRTARAPGREAPALIVEIEQRGRVVYRSPAQPGRTSVGFIPAATYLFVEPREPLVVRLLDGQPGVVAARQVRGDELIRLAAQVTTPGGSAVSLRLEPRRRAGRGAADRGAVAPRRVERAHAVSSNTPVARFFRTLSAGNTRPFIAT